LYQKYMHSSIKKAGKKVTCFYTEHSTAAFFTTLAILFGCIWLSNFLRTPAPEEAKQERSPKQTAVYSAETPGTVSALTTVKKEGTSTIVALTAGIVSSIHVRPGQAVQNGSTLLTLTNDYNSGSAALQREIAKNNLFLSQEISQLDKDIQKNEERITRSDNTLSDAAEEVALDTLQKDRTTRKVSLANSELSYDLSTKSDAVLKPKALSAGYIQSVAVKNGHFVTPGQVLATIVNPYRSITTIEALVPSEVAPYINITKEVTFILDDGSTLAVVPTYFSAYANEEGMFLLSFTLSVDMAEKIILGKSPRAELPLRFQVGNTILVPLDAIFKNPDGATVLVVKEGEAESRMVTLGAVRGDLIEVTTGIEISDQIILNRFVLAGDTLDIVTTK
jgi:RND family efflux transporter MFP subunit